MTLTMATNIVVITDAGTLTPEIKDEIGAYGDIFGSRWARLSPLPKESFLTIVYRSDVNAPIVAGIWDLFDRKTPTESCTEEWDEMKYVVKGRFVLLQFLLTCHGHRLAISLLDRHWRNNRYRHKPILRIETWKPALGSKRLTSLVHKVERPFNHLCWTETRRRELQNG